MTEVVRLYGIRHWIEQSYKQVKTELGWANFQVRSDIAIRRHQTLVNCAFSFCWNTFFGPPAATGTHTDAVAAEPTTVSPVERGRRTRTAETVLAQSITPSPRLAYPMAHPAAPMDRMDSRTATG